MSGFVKITNAYIEDSDLVEGIDPQGRYTEVFVHRNEFNQHHHTEVGSEEIHCPFCLVDGFDDIGLKYHLRNHCEKFNQVPNP